MGKVKLRRIWYIALLVVITASIPIFTMLIGGNMPNWSDEFDGPAGTPPDTTTWTYVDNQPPGGGNNELEYYIPEGTALDGQGRLAITARRDNGTYPAWYGPSQFTSGKIWTRGKVAFRYGHVEVRAQIPQAGQPGAWPAIWMMGEDLPDVGWPKCGEIDIMESFGVQNSKVTFSSALHTPTDNPAQTYTLPTTNDLTQYHNFALDWQPTVLSFSVDGHTYWTVHKSDFRTWPFDKPFFLILNYAVGGQMGGNIPANAPLPYTMNVSYTKVFNSEITR